MAPFSLYPPFQIDEIEALTAIYEDDWCVVDEASRIYCIGINELSLGDDSQTAKWKVCLQIILPEDYPAGSPPIYQIK